MKRYRPYPEALAIAESLLARLEPRCQRIALAGSLRRGKELIGDIEIVAIPKPRLDLFGDEVGWEDPTAGLGVTFTKNGPRYKQFLYESLPVDLYLTSPAQWGVILAIRTGPGEFSRRLVTPRLYGGLLPPGYHCAEGRLWHEGHPLDTPEEEDVFRALGLPFIPPAQRGTFEFEYSISFSAPP